MSVHQNQQPELGVSQPSSYIYGIDIIRFISAILVVSFHLGFKAWILPSSSLYDHLPKDVHFPSVFWIFGYGWIGVQIFFVVSGAVIVQSLKNSSPLIFAQKRLLRLVPSVLIAVGLGVPVAIGVFQFSIAETLVHALRNIAFWPQGPWLIGQFWTIPIELSFYGLVWAVLFLKQPDVGMSHLKWGIGLASCTYWMLYSVGFSVPLGRFTQLVLLQHGAYFTLGMLCHQLAEHQNKRGHRFSVLDAMLGSLCICVAGIQIYFSTQLELEGVNSLMKRWWVAYSIWLVLTICIGLSYIYAAKITQFLSAWVNDIRTLGLMTYPLYLIHMHVGGAFTILLRDEGVVTRFLISLSASLCIAYLIVKWLEKPIFRFLRNVMDISFLRSKKISKSY